jgi:hypothetical protein
MDPLRCSGRTLTYLGQFDFGLVCLFLRTVALKGPEWTFTCTFCVFSDSLMKLDIRNFYFTCVIMCTLLFTLISFNITSVGKLETHTRWTKNLKWRDMMRVVSIDVRIILI